LRCERSPVAPKMVKSAGSVAPPTRSPVRSGFSALALGSAALPHGAEPLLDRLEQ